MLDSFLKRGKDSEQALYGTPTPPGRRLLPPAAEFQVPTSIPSSSERPKTSNSLIVYARTVPVSYLEKIGSLHARQERELVFVCHSEGMMRGTVAMHGTESLNAAFRANTQQRDSTALATTWRLDGVLLSPPEENGDRGTLSVNVGLSGPCAIRNVFSARPLVWDICFLGLFTDPANGAIFYKPFSSQVVDLHEGQLRQPTAPQLDRRAGRSIPESVTNPVKGPDLANMVGAYYIGRVMDTDLSPGVIQVYLRTRWMSAWFVRELLVGSGTPPPQLGIPSSNKDCAFWIGRLSSIFADPGDGTVAPLSGEETSRIEDIVRSRDFVSSRDAEALVSIYDGKRTKRASRAISEVELRSLKGRKRLSSLALLVSCALPDLLGGLERAVSPDPDTETDVDLLKRVFSFLVSELYFLETEFQASSVSDSVVERARTQLEERVGDRSALVFAAPSYASLLFLCVAAHDGIELLLSLL